MIITMMILVFPFPDQDGSFEGNAEPYDGPGSIEQDHNPFLFNDSGHYVEPNYNDDLDRKKKF